MTVRKRFGQHFLRDEAALERIFACLALRDTDGVLEIGPGPGTLTRTLLAESGWVRAVEIDRDLAEGLRAELPDLDLVQADVLQVDLAELAQTLPGARKRIVGNLPYNLSTPLLGRLFELATAVTDIHVMLQKEVADRLVARPGESAYGRLSVMAGLYCTVIRLFDVAPEAFTPPPKVWSSFVRLEARSRPDVSVTTLREVLGVAFSGRRKRLDNALKSFGLDWGALGIDAGLRPDAVSIEDYVAIARAVSARTEGFANHRQVR